MANETITTTSHDAIRIWTEDRAGVPASVAETMKGDDVGILRIHFPGQGSGDDLDQITWEEFFQKFEDEQLAFLCEIHTTEGDLSRFSKLVRRSDPVSE